jgi:hypothetical protein
MQPQMEEELASCGIVKHKEELVPSLQKGL